MMYNPETIGNWFLEQAWNEGRILNALHVLKLVYLAHGWHLALTGKPLINESVEAYEYGPVIRSLYKKMETFRLQPIIYYIHEDDFQNLHQTEMKNERDILRKVWDAYKGFSATQLSTISHMEGSPWTQVKVGSIISDSLIEKYYKKQASLPKEDIKNVT